MHQIKALENRTLSPESDWERLWIGILERRYTSAPKEWIWIESYTGRKMSIAQQSEQSESWKRGRFFPWIINTMNSGSKMIGRYASACENKMTTPVRLSYIYVFCNK